MRLGLQLACLAMLMASVSSVQAGDQTVTGKMSTAETQDIINTLRKEGRFHKMLSGLQIAYDLDNKLKGKGPFTVFAADDKAWAKINQADQTSLFENKKKLAQVLSYQVVNKSRMDSTFLKSLKSVGSMEGHAIRISVKKNDKDEDDLFVDKAKVKKADIICSNGIIHIVDQPIMPPLAK